ncbi:chromosome partitioning protein [Methanocella sp. CWC-04]|uniref:Chromosome partitioning protein n=2 Tax=Methanooceanicella nereidis TaxID=2052831 RepID=A0AAP2RC57_9EURY|nr:chromosome partitioning protein [Methanocella sp. CWC-04]
MIKITNADTGLEIIKHWDDVNERMIIFLKNGENSFKDVTVEDLYPVSLSGMICFARSGGVAPMATASGGKITWRIPNVNPGDVKELIYTSLTRETLNNHYMKKRPSQGDAGLLAGMASVKPSLRSEQHADVDGPVEIRPEVEQGSPDNCKSLSVLPQSSPIANPGKRGTVISVGAGKGGTGKTTFSINLGVALSEMGSRTVIMDADASMSNLATYIGIDPQNMKATLHEVLSGEAEPDKAAYKVFNDNLLIVPSGLSIEGFLKMDRDLLNDVIEYFSSDADFIVIDTPAGYNKEVALSLLASDHLILVLNPDEGSMTDGIKVQEMARILGVNVIGIVLNRFDMKNPQFTRSQVEEYFGTPVIAMLPEDPGTRRKDKVPVVLASPNSRIASEFYSVARSLAGRNDFVPAGSPSFVTKLMDALFRS